MRTLRPSVARQNVGKSIMDESRFQSCGESMIHVVKAQNQY